MSTPPGLRTLPSERLAAFENDRLDDMSWLTGLNSLSLIRIGASGGSFKSSVKSDVSSSCAFIFTLDECVEDFICLRLGLVILLPLMKACEIFQDE